MDDSRPWSCRRVRVLFEKVRLSVYLQGLEMFLRFFFVRAFLSSPKMVPLLFGAHAVKKSKQRVVICSFLFFFIFFHFFKKTSECASVGKKEACSVKVSSSLCFIYLFFILFCPFFFFFFFFYFVQQHHDVLSCPDASLVGMRVVCLLGKKSSRASFGVLFSFLFGVVLFAFFLVSEPCCRRCQSCCLRESGTADVRNSHFCSFHRNLFFSASNCVSCSPSSVATGQQINLSGALHGDTHDWGSRRILEPVAESFLVSFFFPFSPLFFLLQVPRSDEAVPIHLRHSDRDARTVVSSVCLEKNSQKLPHSSHTASSDHPERSSARQ